MDDDVLRILTKQTKIYRGVAYSRVADELGIRRSSFYNWLKGQYSLSSSRKAQLLSILHGLSQ